MVNPIPGHFDLSQLAPFHWSVRSLVRTSIVPKSTRPLVLFAPFSSKGRVIYYQLGVRLYSGGGRKFFWWCTGGVENKMTYGQGGHVFRQVLWGGGGSDVFHWSFFSLKFIASGGAAPPRPPLYPSSIMWDFLNHWATLEIKYALFLLNNDIFLQMSPSSFSALNNNHYHQC